MRPAVRGVDQNARGCRYRTARWLGVVLAGGVAFSRPLTLAARAASRVLFDPKEFSTALSANLIDSGQMRQLALQRLYTKENEGELTATDFVRVCSRTLIPNSAKRRRILPSRRAGRRPSWKA
jgi:hypothetical protein